LGIPDELCIAGVKDKVNLINNLCEKYKLSFSQILVFGDDYLDTKIKKDIPEIIFACPLNAPFYFYHMADLVLPKPGGQHAFRLLVDLVLYVQKKHFAQDIISQALKVYKV
jgi:3-deoxy-D-manno-octulosonate 8-phosphate phosphatase KdsC-like HAD superfamily phosphatase